MNPEIQNAPKVWH